MEPSTPVPSIPDDFICPLTLEVMEIPCMTRWGHNFEKGAIIRWLDNHNACPLTRNLLTFQDIIVNRPLRSRIQWWKKQNGLSGKADSATDDEEDDGSSQYNELDENGPYVVISSGSDEVIQGLQARNDGEGGKVLLEFLKTLRRKKEGQRSHRAISA